MITQQNPASKSQDPSRDYLIEISRFPLLTDGEEITCGKRVQRMIALLTEKEQPELHFGFEPNLKQWAEQVQMSEAELNRAVQQGRRAKKKMIEAKWLFKNNFILLRTQRTFAVGDNSSTQDRFCAELSSAVPSPHQKL